MRGRKQTVYLAAFCAILIAAVSASLAWVFLGLGNDARRIDNGSYQVRGPDGIAKNLFREDMEGIEPGTYQTDGPLEDSRCAYALPQIAGMYPFWDNVEIHVVAAGPASVVIPPDGGVYPGESGGFYSRGCQPWERVEAEEAS